MDQACCLPLGALRFSLSPSVALSLSHSLSPSVTLPQIGMLVALLLIPHTRRGKCENPCKAASGDHTDAERKVVELTELNDTL